MTDILCIIPVDPNDRPPEARDLPYKPTPGMVHCPCELCGKAGWLGPKQAATKAARPDFNIVCMTCLFQMAKDRQQQGEKDFVTDVTNLDNS